MPIILRPKHYLLFSMGLILAVGIFYVNYVIFYGNTLGRCLYLSVFTFLFWWLCWSLYFEIRDFWQFRWYGPRIDLAEVSITPIEIPLNPSNPEITLQDKSTKLGGELVHHDSTPSDAPIIIFIHGFSDDSEYIRHFSVSLAHAGFDVVAYDNRGTKKSRKVGSSSQFVEITDDLEYVIRYVKKQKHLKNRPLFLVGISLGAIAAIKQGINYPANEIQKIVGIASMGNYKNSIPFSPVPFMKNWWFWLRYTFFGVPINPPVEQNVQLSPSLLLQRELDLKSSDPSWKESLQRRILLIHSRNDQVIDIQHFWENLSILELPSSNWLITQKGGHNFLRFEPIVLAKIINHLKS
ncbi:MAG: alpha/beta hydrolase [Promethearchaeota archaeon]